MKEFYIKRGEQGKVFGPVTSQKLVALAKSDKLQESDYVSLDGDSWSFASNVQGLFPVETEDDLFVDKRPKEEREAIKAEYDDDEPRKRTTPRRSSGTKRRRIKRDEYEDDNEIDERKERPSRGRNSKPQKSNNSNIMIAALILLILGGAATTYAFVSGGTAPGNLKFLPGKDMDAIVSVNLNDLWQHPEFKTAIESQKGNRQLSLLKDTGLSLTQFTNIHMVMNSDDDNLGAIVIESSVIINPQSLLSGIKKSDKKLDAEITNFNGSEILIVKNMGINYNIFFPNKKTLCITQDGSKEEVSNLIQGKSSDSILNYPAYANIKSKGYFSSSVWVSTIPKKSNSKNKDFASVKQVSGFLNISSDKSVKVQFNVITEDSKSATDMSTKLNQSKAMLGFLGVDKSVSDAIKIEASGSSLTVSANIPGSAIDDLSKKFIKNKK